MSTDSCVTLKKCRALALLIVYISSLIAVGLLVYFFAGRPNHTTSCPKRSSSHHQLNGFLSKSVQNIRLPRNFLPWHYDIRLLPVLEKGNFTVLGRVAIDIECRNITDRIVLHSADIIVHRNSVQVSHSFNTFIYAGNFKCFKQVIEHGRTENAQLLVDGIEYDPAAEFVIIRLNSESQIKLANYTLSMNFEAKLTNSSVGFFRSAYMEDGVER